MTNKLALAAGAVSRTSQSIHPISIPTNRLYATREYREGPPVGVKREAASAKQAIITPIAPPAIRTAYGLALPSSLARSDGKPKMPLPIIELITSAAMLQRPMARTRVTAQDSVIGRVYHRKSKHCEGQRFGAIHRFVLSVSTITTLPMSGNRQESFSRYSLVK